MNWKNQLCMLNLSAVAGTPPYSARVDGRGSPAAVECPTRKRLAKAFARLRNIELVRNHRSEPEFGKTAEERIIWRELLELELQEINNEIDA